MPSHILNTLTLLFSSQLLRNCFQCPSQGRYESILIAATAGVKPDGHLATLMGKECNNLNDCLERDIRIHRTPQSNSNPKDRTKLSSNSTRRLSELNGQMWILSLSLGIFALCLWVEISMSVFGYVRRSRNFTGHIDQWWLHKMYVIWGSQEVTTGIIKHYETWMPRNHNDSW